MNNAEWKLVDPFTREACATLLWQATTGDDAGTPLDREHDVLDIVWDANFRTFAEQCRAFEAWAYEHGFAELPHTQDQLAHDYVLTRLRHGAGFWDGDWPEPFATLATARCKLDSECADLYAGDDGELYLTVG